MDVHSPVPDTTKILIADDDEATRILLRVAIAPWGYQIAEAKDGEEAWEILHQPNPPAILLLDWLMPRLDGIELCKRIDRELSYHPYIIFLTSMSGTENVIQGLEAGADEFVLKPFDLTELRIRIYAGERILQYRQQVLQHEKQIKQLTDKMHELAKDYAKKMISADDLLSVLQDEYNDLGKLQERLQTDEKVNSSHLNKMAELQLKFKNTICLLKNNFEALNEVQAWNNDHVREVTIDHSEEVAPATRKKMPIIDLKRMQAFFGNDLNAIKEFIGTYIALSLEHVQEIAKAIEKKDTKAAKYYFHLLGGASGNSGITKIFRTCEKAEEKILVPDWDAVQECYLNTAKLLEDLKLEMERLGDK